ncbi:hypothetical protein N7492_002383 [Penicillium capsulatum]|uniref:Glycosyl transferase CAP10 domain-containing protein n=1 Tax=Penicillium capsulatum TaxID=69766 RepID=A0A9W9IHH2_9EURO|nr:hypothetical protein N7492_002383 [Penicillium capsulatum]
MVQLSVDTGLKVSVGIFFLSSFFLATSYKTTFAFDRPVTTAIVVCFLTGATFLLLGRFMPLASIPSSHTIKPTGIPLAEQYELPSRASSPSPALGPDQPTTLRSRFSWRITLLIALCCLRVEFFRQITRNTECVPAGYSYAIPLLVSIYDYWRNQRWRAVGEYDPSQRFQSLPVMVAYSAFRRALHYVTQSHFRGVIAAALVSLGGHLAVSFLAGSQSTYICPIVLHGASRMQMIRLLNVLVDSTLLVGVAELFHQGVESTAARGKRTLTTLGAGLLAVSFLWVIISFFVANARPEHSGQLLLDPKYSQSALSQALLVVFLSASAWYMLPHFGIMGVSILAGFVFIYFSSMSTLVHQQMPFPFISRVQSMLPFITLIGGVLLFLLARIFSAEEPKSFYRANIILQIIICILGSMALIFGYSKHRLTHTHPIDLLIHKGSVNFEKFTEQASTSKSLDDAVQGYRTRYNHHPPPGFDKWYEYATKRNSVVIDDFDQLWENLLPFRALSPGQIRDMTQKLATNPFNDLGGIQIRSGKPKVQEGIKPTHAWMVQGAANMIEKFSEHLPDMDLVFNLNDEPRVALPWEKTLALKREARAQQSTPDEQLQGHWSPDRQNGWGPIEPADQTNETIFTDGAWRGIFDPYVSAICPPSSKARSQRIWNRHDICLECAAPHTMGQFPLNFELASDICHQPDLAFLHGLLISPASFKVSQELIPVFSQSALTGFGDILFPSPWNYMDKAKYNPSGEFPDPEYEQKDNTLYWAGSTSEGVSQSGEWKGMPRQRFSHLINNNTHNQVSVLLPTQPGRFRYEIMGGSAPSEELQLQTQVHLADPIARCGADCDEQLAEMSVAPWVDFQKHWSHRFLFDLDGAGFSGRFLPFLQSRSLPLKTGLFRQWFDPRVISWFHFVPIDIRLHGLWSTLAYFAGVPNPADASNSQQRSMRMPAHDKQGWWIAEQGRRWTETALRKEDMEIYMFRLLLEWGRLTDDQRDVLGYKA